MKKLIALTVCFWLLTGSALVLAAPFLVCDPQGGVDNYKVEIIDSNSVVVASPDVAPDSMGTYGFVLDLAPLNLPDGSYTVRASASNMWGTSSWSTAYPFDKSVVDTPANIRLVPNLP
jgi:hypothetical protein